MELEEALRHAGPIWTGERQHDLERRARQALPHYLFTWKEGGKKKGYCTYCLNTVTIRREDMIPDYVRDDPYADEEDSFHHPERAYGFAGPYQGYSTFDQAGRFDQSGKHLHWGDCPCCGCRAQYRGMGMGRKTLSDRVFLIQYQKSADEENALVMTGWLVICDWGKWNEYEQRLPDLYMDLREVCVFRPGMKGERFIKRILWFGEQQEDGKLLLAPDAYWQHPKQCHGGFDPWGGSYCYRFGNAGTRFMRDEETMDEALAGSWMEPLWYLWKDEINLDCITWMENMTRYPCAEYFFKLGLASLLRDLAFGDMAGHLLNHRGKTAQKVLRVDGDFWGWIKGNHVDVSQALLKLYQAGRKLKLRIGNDKLLRLSKALSPENLNVLNEKVGRENLEKTLNYILKKNLAYFDYRDHLQVMEELDMPLRDPAMLWPKDFQALHTELSNRVKIRASAKKAAEMEKRTDALSSWWFSALGLSIRPFLTPEEIVREGSEMRHCVGTYVQRYASGGTVLLALREDERPGKPFRTVEYTPKGQLVQCRGYRNKSPEDEQPRIDEFFRLFDAYRAEYERLNGKKKGRWAA